MANIAFYASHPEMMEQARAASEASRLELAELKLVSTSEVVEEANRSAANGIDIIIARGSQAALIRRYSRIPVVDVVLTGQEIALLIYKAKEILKKGHPKIGLIGFENMFCDISLFDQIFDVTIREYFAKYSEELPAAVDLAISEGAELIIGGDKALQWAQKRGIPALFLTSTQDSINEAFRVAKKVAYVSDLEQKNSAELSTLLDYSFNGIMKIDAQGKVVILNHIAQNLIGESRERIVGAPVSSLIHEITADMLAEVLSKGRDIHALFLVVNQTEVMANIAPIKVAASITGAIISWHEVRKFEEIGAKTRLELHRSGRIARQNFNRLEENSFPIRRVIHLAKRYACCDSPVLIQGEPGTEKNIFAECIHNSSSRRGQAYVPVDCADMSESEQDRFFRPDSHNNGAQSQWDGIRAALHGTLFIGRVENLTLRNQHYLDNILQEQLVLNSDRVLPSAVDIRIIASTSQDLRRLTEEGKFIPELYYRLAALTLQIPPLRERPEDVATWTKTLFTRYCSQYSRYLALTDEAKYQLTHYRWDGNLIQLESFCRRLAVNAPKKVIDGRFVQEELNSAYPDLSLPLSRETDSAIFMDPKAAELMRLMNRCNGNRARMAKELGVSKTTLWRRLKKYNLKV